MDFLYITNIFFEKELEGSLNALSATDAMMQSDIFIQLQFASIFTNPFDATLGLTHAPLDSYKELLTKNGFCIPHLHLLSEPLPTHIKELRSWGASHLLKEWAQEKNLVYDTPSFVIVKKINSKSFILENYPHLNLGSLLYTKEELRQWLSESTSTRVIKTPQGYSGKGLLIIHNNTPMHKIDLFVERLFLQDLPVIGQIWYERLLDFSTQWFLSKEGHIEYIGSTIMNNSSKGVYQGSKIAPDPQLFGEYLPYLDAHKKAVAPLLQDIVQMGYYGYLGIDAMLYKDGNEHPTLCPALEINARQTMGLVGVYIQKTYYPQSTITLEIGSKNPSSIPLLPQEVKTADGTLKAFPSNLFLRVNPNK